MPLSRGWMQIQSNFSCSLDLYDFGDVVTEPTCRCVCGSKNHFDILRPLSTPLFQNPHFQTLHLYGN